MKKIIGILLVAIVIASGANFAKAENQGEAKVVKVEAKTVQKVEKLEKLESMLQEKSLWQAEKVHPEDKSLVVSASGNFRAAGVVVNSVSGDAKSLNVNFFGFTKDIRVEGAKIIGAGANTLTIADIKAGNKLALMGRIDPSTNVITVEKINNLSYRNADNSSDRAAIEKKIKELLDMIEKLKAKLPR